MSNKGLMTHMHTANFIAMIASNLAFCCIHTADALQVVHFLFTKNYGALASLQVTPSHASVRENLLVINE